MNSQSSGSGFTEAPFPNVCIHHRFEYQARKHPEATAVTFEADQLTYGELNQKANQLTGYLQHLGVEPGNLIGIFLERSLDVITGILGILKNGCGYVPMDPAYPEERLRHMIADSASPVILTVSHLKRLLPQTRAQIVCIDSDWNRISEENSNDRHSDQEPTSLAYAIFTSGSTGKPKGVRCHHRGVINLLTDFQNRQSLGAGDICSWWTSLNFDVSVYEIFSPLMEGAALTIVPESVRVDAPSLMDWLSKEKITSAYLPPFMVADLDVWLKEHPENSALRRLLVGVEAIPENLLNSINDLVPDLHIINGYGPTEATVCATLYSIGSKSDLHENTPIGKPVQNTNIYLLDEEGKQVPAGDPGEICIGGVGVAHGYLNRPDLTAKSFIPDSFSNKVGEKLYKTGDSARFMPDGNIEFIGRTDFQVKFHGYRIELGEIETELRKNPTIREAVVLLREDIPGVKRLVAYLVCYEEKEVSTNKFRKLLKKSLPDYMVPSVFVLLDKIPMTSNGKTDRSALPPPSESDVVQLRQTDYRPPETAEEIGIASLFTELLQIDRVGGNDSFFELGGQSLLATQLCSRIEKSLDVRIPLQAVFEGPTVSQLAQTIEETRKKEGTAKFPEILPASGERSQFPASFAQQGMWFIQQLSENSILYNIPLIVRINGPLRFELLNKTVNEIIKRHESLRTTLAINGEKIVQHVSKKFSVVIPVTDLSRLQVEKRENEFERLAAEEGRYPFDLEKGPLLRFLLVQFGEKNFRLVFTIHHAIIDGWGAGIFFSELQALYEAFVQDKPSPLPSISIQYGDFAVWQQKWLKSDAAKDQLAYWRKKLADLPAPLKLPLDRPRPQVQTNPGSRHHVKLSKALTAALKEIGRNENVSLYMLLLGIYQTLFHKYSGQEDIITGSTIANRNHPQVEEIIGVFINAIAMRTDFSGDPTFHELLKRVRRTTLEAYANQDIPFEHLVQNLVQERDASRHPLFQAILILQNMPWPSMEFCDLKISYDEVGNHTSKLDLLMVFEERKGALEGWIEYNPDLFDHATIESMAANFQHLAEQIVGNPDRRLSQIALQHRSEPISKGLSCYIIGETSLPMKCAEILLRQGYHILGLISPDATNQDWAVENDVPYFHPKQDLAAIMRRQPFDFLFSIVNSHVLSPEILRLPKKYAINYHDAFLPRYAGVYSTSWAIINREKTHGISWHLMAEEVDTGDILRQYPVDIEPDDTALTLNARCYETALQAFSELVKDLALNEENLSKQDLKKRTYFPLYKRPPSAGVLSWNQDAEDMDALVRAMTFGAAYPNEMVSPKIAVGMDFFIISKLGILDSTSHKPAGTIVEIRDKSLTISTRTCDISLQGLLTIDGKGLSIHDFVMQFDLHAGDHMEDLDPELAQRLTETNDKICKFEPFWLRRLQKEQPVENPYFNRTNKTREPAHPLILSLPIPAELTRLSEVKGQKNTFESLVISAFMAFLARLSNLETLTLGYRPITLIKDQDGLENLFVSCVPLTVTIDLGFPFNRIKDMIQKQIDLVIQHKTYAKDVFIRHPGLSSAPRPIQVSIGSPEDSALPEGASLAFFISQDASALEWHYDPSVLSKENVHRMKGQFNLFLSACLSEPSCPMWELPLLTPEESHRILVEWNANETNYPEDKGIHQLFEAQVARTPNRTAIVHNSKELSYDELNRRANQLAHHLISLGVKTDIPVGLFVERSFDMAIGVLGILKAGGAYLPLDPGYPEERLAFMIHDSETPVIVTQKRIAGSLPEHEAQIVIIDSDWDLIMKKDDKNPASQSFAANLAYVMYTSGSTGQPKGVLVPHNGVVNHCLAVTEQYDIRSDDRVLQFFSINFDGSVEELFPAWSMGAAVILRSEEMLASTTNFMQWIEQEDITVIDLPTAYWHELVNGLALSGASLPKALRVVIVGGEKASMSAYTSWAKISEGRVRWFNTYGPTECTVVATVYEPDNLVEYRVNELVLPIGRPIANTQIYILDKNLQPLPVGVPGEMFIGGAGVARGYLNRPELTADRFIKNPFSVKPDDRLYKTGDLVRYHPDGNIEFMGRKDFQVKFRGFRVEPGEIERVIDQYPLVRESVVMLREDVSGQKFLAAYWTAKEGTSPIPAEPREFLKDKLPEYMVPAAFILMDAFPLSPNGKVNRGELPVPEETGNESDAPYVPPRNQTESMIANIWSEVLGIKRIGIHDNFFELGGHSLLTLQVLDRAHHEGINLTPQQMFKYQTIGDLAEVLDPKSSVNEEPTPGASLVALQPNGSRPPIFLIHTTPGDILGYGNLVHHLGPDQPCYGFQSLGLYQPERAHTTIEEMAAYYVRLLLSFKPEGPYILGGWCYGGIVSVEMAKQLLAQGHKMDLLLLIDTWAPRPEWEYYPFYLNRVGCFLRMGTHRWIHYLKAKMKRKMRSRPQDVSSVLAVDLEYGHLANRKHVLNSNMQAVKRYRSKPYPGRVILFNSEDPGDGIIPDPKSGWSTLAAKVETHPIASSHRDMLQEPQVKFLAEQIRECIDSVCLL